jgi:hypothetical protein
MRHRRERWLHARISEDLEEALKREARRRRSPVSLVVRNVLEGALDLVEDLVEDGIEVARRSQRLARRTRGGKEATLDEVYGWQDVILNRAAQCAACDAGIAAGGNAYRGLREQPGPPVFLCAPCLARLRRPRPKAGEPKEDPS